MGQRPRASINKAENSSLLSIKENPLEFPSAHVVPAALFGEERWQATTRSVTEVQREKAPREAGQSDG